MKQVYRVNEVAKMLSVSPSTIWRWVREGDFPQPKKLGARVTIWTKQDIEKVIGIF